MGCSDETCREADAAIVLHFTFEQMLDADRAETLEVILDLSGERRRRVFSLGHTGADGRISLAVNIVPPPQTAFSVRVTANALDSHNEVVCSRIYTFDATPDACNELTIVLLQRILDAGVPDAASDAGEAGSDAEVEDLGVIDGGVPDSGEDRLCDNQTTPETVALYPFMAPLTTTVTDIARGHDGEIVNPSGVQLISGPDQRCGTALYFRGDSDGTYVEIPNAEDFDLEEGSLSFWLRIEGDTNTTQGIISRDALGMANPGHLTIARTCEDLIVVRAQQIPTRVRHVCSNEPIPRDQWVHVAVNFGAPSFELYIDSVRATRTGTVALFGGVGCTGSAICGEKGGFGIGGNENPWVIGASSASSQEGSAEPIAGRFVGALDHLRIQEQRVTY